MITVKVVAALVVLENLQERQQVVIQFLLEVPLQLQL
jgi:hypothetical protein